MGIGDRYRATREEVDEVCRASGRDPKGVLLLAVSKTVDCEGVRAAVASGATSFGENRPDQIVMKQHEFPQCSWHFIGNVQSRRIGDIVGAADLIHSVYQQHHLPKIDAAAAKLGKVQNILMEVNVSGEESKSGLAPETALEFARYASTFDSIRLAGLMTMAPQGDPKAAKACFSALHRLRSDLREQMEIADGDRTLSELSMGMSEDWRIAVAQGATIVRIGRAIFSDEFSVA